MLSCGRQGLQRARFASGILISIRTAPGARRSPRDRHLRRPRACAHLHHVSRQLGPAVPLSWRARALLIALPSSWACSCSWIGSRYLWLEALGLESVFWTIRPLKAGLFLSVFMSVLFYFWINFRILSSHLGRRRLPPSWAAPATAPELSPLIRARRTTVKKSGHARSGTPGLLILAAVVVALIFAAVFYSQWDTLLRFHGHWRTARLTQSSRDIGFYLFELPFLELLQNGILAATFLASSVLMVAYWSAGPLRLGWREGVSGPPRPLRHLAADLALFLVALAWGYYLDRFALLQSSRGGLWRGLHRRVHRPPGTLDRHRGYACTGGGAAFPAHYRQRCSRADHPGRLSRHLGHQSHHHCPGPYKASMWNRMSSNWSSLPPAQHCVHAWAYGLDRIEGRSYSPSSGLTLTDLGRNNETISNIRLWDWRPLGETFPATPADSSLLRVRRRRRGPVPGGRRRPPGHAGGSGAVGGPARQG